MLHNQSGPDNQHLKLHHYARYLSIDDLGVYYLQLATARSRQWYDISTGCHL